MGGNLYQQCESPQYVGYIQDRRMSRLVGVSVTVGFLPLLDQSLRGVTESVRFGSGVACLLGVSCAPPVSHGSVRGMMHETRLSRKNEAKDIDS